MESAPFKKVLTWSTCEARNNSRGIISVGRNLRPYPLSSVQPSILTFKLDRNMGCRSVLLAKGDEKQIEKIVKKHVNYNIEHIMRVIVYRIRKLFKEVDSNGKIGLGISDKDTNNFFKGLIEAIYRGYVEWRLKGLPSSLTTVVRSSDFYKKGEEAYIALKNPYNLNETDFIDKNKLIVT